MVATTKITWSALASIASVAAAQVWITAMLSNLKACGLVQTADSGQLDPASISALPGAGGYFGYWVFRFDDLMQSNKPVFLRFAPFIGSHGGANSSGLAVTVGFATDGAGNIVGPTSGVLNFFNSTGGAQRTESGVATPCYAIHGEGHFSLCAHAGVRTNTYNTFCMCFLSISRTLDGHGRPTAEGIVVRRPGQSYDITAVAGSATLSCNKTPMTVVTGSTNNALGPWIGGQDSASSGGNAQIQRTYMLAPTIQPDPVLVMYWNAAITTGDEFEVAVDGIPRRYLALGNGITLAADSAAHGRSVGFGMLWGDL